MRADLAQLDAARAERMPTIAVSSSYAPVAYPASRPTAATLAAPSLQGTGLVQPAPTTGGSGGGPP